MSDEILREQILVVLSADSRTNGADLRVGVLNGVVHLAGQVVTIELRAAAEELAGQVPGVRGIVNRIEAPGAPSPSRIINITLTTDEQDRD